MVAATGHCPTKGKQESPPRRHAWHALSCFAAERIDGASMVRVGGRSDPDPDDHRHPPHRAPSARLGGRGRAATRLRHPSPRTGEAHIRWMWWVSRSCLLGGLRSCGIRGSVIGERCPNAGASYEPAHGAGPVGKALHGGRAQHAGPQGNLRPGGNVGGRRKPQELLAHRDVATTMLYTHVLNRGPAQAGRRSAPPLTPPQAAKRALPPKRALPHPSFRVRADAKPVGSGPRYRIKQIRLTPAGAHPSKPCPLPPQRLVAAPRSRRASIR